MEIAASMIQMSKTPPHRLAGAALTSFLCLAFLCAPGAVRAAEQTIAVVQTASAQISGHGRHAVLTLQASVGLPNSCWSKPRFQTPAVGTRPDADGVVQVQVVARSTEGPGVMCSMIFRTGVKVPALHWRTRARGLKAIKVIGSMTPVTAEVTTAP